MSGYSADSGIGRVTGGQIDTIWRPRTPRSGTCGVVLLPGAGNPRAYMDSVAQPASTRLAAALAAAGIPCITSDFHGNSWGIDSVMTAITDARATLEAAYPSMRTDKVCLLGGSMGGSAVARYSQLNPTEVAAVVGIIPAYNIKYEYENIAGTVADIEAAWGFSGLGNYPLAADLMAGASLAADVPYLTGYATNDTIVPSAGILAYTAIVGGTVVSLGATGHTDAAIAAMPITTVAQFLVANGA